MPNAQLAGNDIDRVEFVRESTQGTTPTNPNFKKYSSNVRTVEFTPNANIAAIRGLGDEDVKDFITGAEDHTISITYDLVQAITDGSGNPKDAAGDAILRNNDSALHNSHSVVARGNVSESGGAAGAGYREYFVGKGAKFGSLSLSIDTGDQQPNRVNMSYNAEKSRVYKIDQPDGSTTLDISSTDSGDTMDITIESEGASTSTTIALNGTTTVTTTTSFSDIDAVELASKATGDVTIKDSSGNTLLTLKGKNSYPHDESDRGVPALGTGSHGSSISGTKENFLDATLERPGGTQIAAFVPSLELTVENNLQEQPDLGTPRKSYDAANRTVELTASELHGEGDYNNILGEHMRNVLDNVKLTTSNSTYTINTASVMDPGSLAFENSQAFVAFDVQFTGQGISVS